MNPSPDPLGAEGVSRVLRELDAWRELPPPTDTRTWGCVATVVAGAGLLGLPVLDATLALPPSLARVLSVLLGLTLLLGLFFGIFTSGDGYARTVVAVEEARRTLGADPPAPGADRVAAATRLLLGAHHTSGPTTVGTFDPDEVEDELDGPTLRLVRAVEARLLEEGAIYPVFTAVDGREEGP